MSRPGELRENRALLWPVPTPVLIVAAIAALYLIAPIVALAVRVPWGSIGAVFRTEGTLVLLKTTITAALWSTAITLLIGIPLAIALQRLRRGRAIARLLVVLPLAMPPVVSGLSLTAFIGRRGVAAPLLDATGLTFAFAFPGVVAAHVFVTLPFVIVAVDSALGQLDSEILASARGVGISRWRTLGRIILPAIAPALATGAGLAFARSLGEFGTTLTFAGSMPGATRTMPLGIYLAREVSAENAYALSAILIGLAILCLALASLPGLFRSQPRQTARAVSPMDVRALAELTNPQRRPDGAVTVTGSEDGTPPTRFSPRRVTAVVGPNGSGKTTLMGLIAGRLEKTGNSVSVPDATRVVLLTQRPGLPRTTTVRGAVTMVTNNAQRTDQLLHAAGLAALADVPVPALSGGQAAHVALVRALATRPALVVLDEPFAAIDVAGAARWRRFFHTTSRARTTLMVTHDAVDLATLADDIAVVSKGQVVTQGAAEDVLAHPPTDFSAAMAGLNRVVGTVTDTPGPTDTDTAVNAVRISVPGGRVVLPAQWDTDEPAHPGASAAAVFAPTALRLVSDESAAKDGEVVFPARVKTVEASSATDVRVTLAALGAVLALPLPWEQAEDTQPGDRVTVALAIAQVRAYPSEASTGPATSSSKTRRP